MARMVRKQIYIAPEQDQMLKRRAKTLGVSEAELIRRGIDHITRVPPAVYADKLAWQEELEFIKKRASEQAPLDGQRAWTREELYEERLHRLSR